MNRRKFLIGAGSLAAGSAAAMGTGAFSSVSANRTLSVETTGDASALLSIDDIDSSENAEYVDTSGGTVSIDITTGAGGEGVNQDASTYIYDLLLIENQGTQDVFVYVSGVPSGFDFYVQNSAGGNVGSPLNNFKNDGQNADGVSANQGSFAFDSNIDQADLSGDLNGGDEGAPLLGPGDSVVIHGYADGSDIDTSSDITINAVAQDE
jgi:hypothetical protein